MYMNDKHDNYRNIRTTLGEHLHKTTLKTRTENQENVCGNQIWHSINFKPLIQAAS